MTANVKILVNQRSNVLKVPNAALRYHPASEPSQARGATGAARAPSAGESGLGAGRQATSRGGSSSRTGETDGTFTEVTGGALKEGDRVIVAALSKAAPAVGRSPRLWRSWRRQRPGLLR